MNEIRARNEKGNDTITWEELNCKAIRKKEKLKKRESKAQ